MDMIVGTAILAWINGIFIGFMLGCKHMTDIRSRK